MIQSYQTVVLVSPNNNILNSTQSRSILSPSGAAWVGTHGVINSAHQLNY